MSITHEVESANCARVIVGLTQSVPTSIPANGERTED